MNPRKILVAFLSVVSLLASSSSALACACCAEHGTYSLWIGTPDSYRLGLLNDMRFGKTADLFMTEAAFESIRGLGSIEKEFESAAAGVFNIVDAYTGNTWRIQIKSPGGKSGTLVLPRPSKMSIFKVDTHEVEVGQGEARLYKEFRFNGTVNSGSGIFKASTIKPTTYSLVFQGRGNECDNAADFTHWRLEVKGSKASYAFFGKMKTSN